MMSKAKTINFLIAVVTFVVTGTGQAVVLCVESDGDISVDRADACSCNWGSEEGGGGYARLVSHSSEEHIPDDGCDPCTDIPLRIDGVHVASTVPFPQDHQPKTVASTAVIWAKEQVSSVPSIREIQPGFPVRNNLPIYLRTASLLI